MNFRVIMNYPVYLFDTCIFVIDGYLLSSCRNKCLFSSLWKWYIHVYYRKFRIIRKNINKKTFIVHNLWFVSIVFLLTLTRNNYRIKRSGKSSTKVPCVLLSFKETHIFIHWKYPLTKLESIGCFWRRNYKCVVSFFIDKCIAYAVLHLSVWGGFPGGSDDQGCARSVGVCVWSTVSIHWVSSLFVVLYSNPLYFCMFLII